MVDIKIMDTAQLKFKIGRNWMKYYWLACKRCSQYRWIRADSMKGAKFTGLCRNCCPKIMNAKPISVERRRQLSIAHLGKPLSQEQRRRLSEVLTANPKVIARAKAQWQNPNFVKAQMKARQVKPNKAEFRLEQILNKYSPNQWKYVGDGQVVIGGKVPDFLNVNGQKKLIELFGNYWHRGEDPERKPNYYKKYGFDTLVIWEWELNNEETLASKIKKFESIPYGGLLGCGPEGIR